MLLTVRHLAELVQHRTRITLMHPVHQMSRMDHLWNGASATTLVSGSSGRAAFPTRGRALACLAAGFESTDPAARTRARYSVVPASARTGGADRGGPRAPGACSTRPGRARDRANVDRPGRRRRTAWAPGAGVFRQRQHVPRAGALDPARDAVPTRATVGSDARDARRAAAAARRWC